MRNTVTLWALAAGLAMTPSVASAQEMELSDAVAYALKHNPRVAGAAADVREARARIAQRKAVRLPQAALGGSVFRQGPVIEAFRAGDDPIVPPYRWTVGTFLSQVLFDWGQRRAEQKAAERDAGAAGHRLAETENDVRLVVGVTFYNVLRARELRTVAEERKNAAAEQLRVARARFDAGLSPRFDVIRGEAELANAEQEVIEAQNEIALAEGALNTALGRPVNTPAPLRLTPPPADVDITFERAREAALKSRPQLSGLREIIEGSKESVRARRAENRPQVSLNGAYDRRQATGFSAGYTYNAGLVMSFPFLDSGLTRGRVREAEAILDHDRQALEQARQQVELDVYQSLLDIGEARKRIETAGKEQQSAREALRVAEVRYRAGLGTNVEVTDAQVAVARAGQNVANAQFDYQTALARLEYATGGPVATLK